MDRADHPLPYQERVTRLNLYCIALVSVCRRQVPSGTERGPTKNIGHCPFERFVSESQHCSRGRGRTGTDKPADPPAVYDRHAYGRLPAGADK